MRVNRTLAWAAAIVDELARAGVEDVVVSPGSRSAPLALAAANAPEIRDHSILDERSAAFFSLGLARVARRPVALVCTSGTAAVNYAPAVAEASFSGIPIVVLTADRPPELRDVGAGQTLDQLKLYGGFVRGFTELPTPEIDDALFRYARAATCRAVSTAIGPDPGPVHVNVPLRDPLAPLEVAEDQAALERLATRARAGRGDLPFTSVVAAGARLPAGVDLDRLAAGLSGARGWLVVGPLDAAPAAASALVRLADTLAWPVLAEPLSQVRCGLHDRARLVDAHDAVLRARDFVDGRFPNVVLRFGGTPTSKAYRLALERHPETRQVIVDPSGWSDPSALATDVIRAGTIPLADALSERLAGNTTVPVSSNGFASTWIDAGRIARRTLDGKLDATEELSEPETVRTLARVVPDGSVVFCASSMPVRDVDGFWPSDERRIRFVANRGVNGIDGTLSSALGTAAGSPGATLALVGDLAFLHDISGLVSARRLGVDLVVVVIDNDGGGIFEGLPVAVTTPREIFERHFGTPHGLDLPEVVRGFGVPCETVRKAREMGDAVERALELGGVRVVRVVSERTANAELHAALFSAVEAALAADAT